MVSENGRSDQAQTAPEGFVMLRDSFILNEMRSLSPRAVVALLAILQHANSGLQAYPSLDRIAEIMGGSKDTARRAIEDLVTSNLLTRTERPGSSFLYTVSNVVCYRDSKSATPPRSGGGNSATPGDSKSATGGIANLQQEPYSVNHTQLNQKDDQICSWNKKLVPASQLKDWCNETFCKSPDGRAALFTRKHLADHPDTRGMLLRVGILHLCGELPEAHVQDGCEALRHAERWPANPGGYLRTVWSNSKYAPTGADPDWFDKLLASVELPENL